MFSTSGGVQYIGECHEYIRGGCSVHRGISWRMWAIPWVHQEMFSTLGGYHEYIGRYHEYIRRCSLHQGNIMMHVGSKLVKTFQFLLKTPMYWTEHLPMYSWYHADVLMASPIVLIRGTTDSINRKFRKSWNFSDPKEDKKKGFSLRDLSDPNFLYLKPQLFYIL